MHKKTVVIAGPTASGKTSLACKIAYDLSSGVISADSRQVYIGMDLGTGKDLNEYKLNERSIPYHCIDVASPKEIYSLYDYQKDCYAALRSYLEEDKTPVICGGTGLYIEAVLNHYEIANVPEDIQFRKSLQQMTKEELCNKLKNTSPKRFVKTDTSSKKRIIRALEIANAEKAGPVNFGFDNAPEIEPLILITDWSRDELIERIDFRLNERLSQGMIAEVDNLMKQGVSIDRLDLMGMEYRQIGLYLTNQKSLNQMKNDLATEIHRLAKRQRTWFRGMERRGFKVHWVKNADYEITAQEIKSFLHS